MASHEQHFDSRFAPWGCSIQRLAGRFTVGRRVRCHADCKLDPEVHECIDGTLTQETRGGNGWWNMNRDTGGETLVHEQELQLLATNSWRIIEGYAPMEECVTATGKEVGWIRPRNLGKHRPQPWGTAADWPGEWEAIPRGDWQLSVYCVSYEAAKAHVEASWPNAAGEQSPRTTQK